VEGLLCFDARSVYEEGIVQDVEVVVEGAQLETLNHLVRAALPRKPLVVQWFLVGADVDRFPMLIRLDSLSCIQNVHPL